jgi:heme exporter protein D
MIKRFSFGATALTLGLLFVQLFSARVLLSQEVRQEVRQETRREARRETLRSRDKIEGVTEEWMVLQPGG